MATKKVENYTGTRITFHSNQPFDTVLSKLYSSIGSPSNVSAWPEIARSITSYSAESRDKFVAGTEQHVGPHGFMIFQVRTPFPLVVSLPFRSQCPPKPETEHGARSSTMEPGSLYSVSEMD